MNRNITAIILIVLGVILAESFYDIYNQNSLEINLDENKKIETSDTDFEDNRKNLNDDKLSDAQKTVVYIEGAVANPGLVYLNDETRIGEIVESAGGLLANADVSNLNMADKVTDGQKITIPTKLNADTSNDLNNLNNDDKININTANEQELQKLPRVGAVTAKKIIEYREKNGNFKTIEEIKNVPRIGEKTFEKFKDMIKV